jgi:hypothetical protein
MSDIPNRYNVPSGAFRFMVVSPRNRTFIVTQHPSRRPECMDDGTREKSHQLLWARQRGCSVILRPILRQQEVMS